MTVSEKLRLVQGLHSHAEMFGFHWDDGSDWTWHDVACKIADEVDAENAKLRELIRDLWLTGSLCDAIPDMRLQAKDGDWRTMQERVDEALGIEVDA